MKKRILFKLNIKYGWLLGMITAILSFQNAAAQYPKLLNNFPVVPLGQSVNSTMQIGGTVLLGGNFNSISAKPLGYGLIFDQFGAATADSKSPVFNYDAVNSIPDGNGGFFAFGGPYTGFTSVNGVAKSDIARINSDGTLNNFNSPDFNQQNGVLVSSGVLVGNTLIVNGSGFNNIGGQSYVMPIAALDATTGQPLANWNNLTIPGLNGNFGIKQIAAANNKLYVLGFDQNNSSRSVLGVINISDIHNPVVSATFSLDLATIDPTTGGGNTITAIAISGNRVFLSAALFSTYDNINHTFSNQTAAGASFNSALFEIDGTTGKFVKAFTTPLTSSDWVTSLVADANNLYVAVNQPEVPKNTIKVYDLQSGTEVSASWPDLTLSTGNTAQTDVVNLNRLKLTLTSAHQLVLYGDVQQVSGNAQSIAAIDAATGALLPWNPQFTQLGSTTLASPMTVTESNGQLFIGGDFTYATKPPLTLNLLAAVNSSTGELLNWADLGLSGNGVNAMAVSDHTLYVGGDFTANNGNIQNLAAFDITDINHPKLIPSFTPNPDAPVNALTVNASTVYVGGNFSTVKGQSRTYLASFDVTGGNGTLTTWNPSPDNLVRALTVFKNRLYVGGAFNNISGSDRVNAASFDVSAAGNPALSNWDAKIEDTGQGIYGGVTAFAPQAAISGQHAERIFIGGYFSNINSGGNDVGVYGLAAVSTSDGKIDPWQLSSPIPNDVNVNALSISKNELYAGGNAFFNSLDISGNFASVDATNYFPPDPNGNTPISGNRGVITILSNTNTVFVGGDYYPAGNFLQTGLAVFQTGDISPLITFADMTNTYGDAPFTPAATSTVSTSPITYSIATGDNPDNVISLANGKVTILKPGFATITASQTGAADVKAKIMISKAVLTVVPQDATTVVNQQFPDFPFTLTGWKNSDDTKNGIYTGKPVFTSTGTVTSPAGTYDLNVSGAGTLTSDYYTFTPSTAKATLTINTVGSTPQTITFAALPAKTYGDVDITLGATTSASVLSVMYKSSDDNIATITGNKLHISGAGTVTITASQAGDPTYAPATDVSQTLTIGKAALTIKADDKTINRGDQLPAFTATYTGLVKGDAATDLDTPPTFTTTATQSSAPGTYPITVADAASDNYNITYAAGKLTIKGTQIVTFAPLSTLTYGDAAFDPGATSDAGASFKPTYTTSNPGVITITNGQAVITGAGTATITATFAAAGGFDLTTATENVTVLKKQLVITADDKARNYGDLNPVFTFTYKGFVYTDNATSGALTTQPIATTTGTATSPAGVYPITISGAAANNYDIIYVNGNLTVSTVARTITFNTIPAKTYGNADFDPGATSNTNETPTYTSSDPAVATILNGQVHIAGAGTATITATFPANSGYMGSNTASQTLTVNKAPLVITTDNKTKTQGPPDITLTASYSGFVNGDNFLSLAIQPVITTTAKTNSPIGTYPIEVSGAASPNYDIRYRSGILSIELGIGQDEVVIASQALSPDGDGINDYFNIGGITNFPANHVTIMNRNGVQVWEGSGYDNSSRKFDGHTTGGNQLQQGTYYFLISYNVNGQQKKKSGYLILKY